MYLDEPGAAGSGLRGLLNAANSGQVTVDPATGNDTLSALTRVQDLIDKMGYQVRRVDVVTPLGEGHARRIGEFNKALATGGENSAQDVLTKYSQEIEKLKEAVRASMAAYQSSDSANADRLKRFGGGQ